MIFNILFLLSLPSPKRMKTFISPSCRIITCAYRRVDACYYSIEDKYEEDLIVCMAYTIIYPDAVVVLAFVRQHINV